MIAKSERDVTADEVSEEGAKNVTIQWLIDSRAGAPNFAMRRFVVGKGGYTPLHSHDWEHEVFVLGGEGVLVDKDGNEMPLKKDYFAFVPPNDIHQFRNAGDENFVFLCVIPIK